MMGLELSRSYGYRTKRIVIISWRVGEHRGLLVYRMMRCPFLHAFILHVASIAPSIHPTEVPDRKYPSSHDGLLHKLIAGGIGAANLSQQRIK